ncbi:MAG: MarR family transcriptional regulator [Epsilonproteobacteria bacterium]|nr:MarR family transcriptional regulator [Campylobacterota bacterium]
MKEEFGQLMGDTARLWKMILSQRLKPLRLSYAKWSAMLLLSRQKDGIIQNELAKLLSIENPTLARILNSLEKDGWIKRVQHSTDKRVKIVYFTDIGEKKFEDSKYIINDLRQEILSGVNDKMLKQNIKTLKTIFKNLTSVNS